MRGYLKLSLFLLLVCLFFVTGCHKHSYEEVITNPTCTEQGFSTFSCSCGDSYIDNYVEATGHSFGEWAVVKEATEEEDGLKERVCSSCNLKEEQIIPSLNHEHSYTSKVTNSTCTEGGYTTYTCKCGDSYTDNETEALGHSFGEWVVVKEATEEEDGLKERECSSCNLKEEQIIPSLEHTHTYTEVVTKPTCTERGYTLYTCKCGDSYKDNETDALGHTEVVLPKVEATCTTTGLTEGKTCSVCNEVLVAQTVIKKLDHTYTEVVTKPTCTESGYTTYTCSCGDSYTDNETEVLGHSYGEWVVVKEATENETGLKEKTCSRCNDKVSETISKLDHTHSYASVVTAPTCTKSGYTTYTCSCGDSYTDNETAPLGHSYGEWKVVKEATSTTTGLKEKTCSRCNNKKTEVIPMISNDNVAVNVTFDLNKGTWTMDAALENKNVLKSVTLTDYLTYDSKGGTRAALNTTAAAIYWKYIVLVETDYEDLYEISEIVYQNSNITTKSYKYVVMWHGALSDGVASATLEDIYSNSDNYIGSYVAFDNLPSSAGTSSFTMNIVEIDLTKNITKTYTDSCSLPTPTRVGYTFKGWKSSIDNVVYTTYPGYKSNPGDITYTAQWEANSLSGDESLDNTYTELSNYFDSLGNIEFNVSLATSNSKYGTAISYSSSHDDILSNKGIYNRPYQATKVTMTITISDGSNTNKYTYDFDVNGYKVLDNIASTYVYREYDKLTDEFFDTMDIIYCAFVLIDVDGGFTGKNGHGSSINYTNNVYLNRMKTYVIDQAHEQGGWVIASIGGGGDSVDLAYEEICKDDAKIEALAQNCVKLINDYGFDGVDIDWEVPDNGENYTKLVKTIYKAVKANNPNHIVTSAIGGGKWQPPKYDLNNSKQYLDYINLMTYEMVSNSGYHHSALYNSSTKFDAANGVGYTLSSCSIIESVKFYKDNYGIPASKLIVGAAFYGKMQTRTSTSSPWTAVKSVYYTNIKKDYLTNSNYEYFYDTKCQAPYLLSKDRLTFISYDDPRSIKAKCAYVISSGCAGIMYWENGCDTTGDLVAAIKEGLSK